MCGGGGVLWDRGRDNERDSVCRRGRKVERERKGLCVSERAKGREREKGRYIGEGDESERVVCGGGGEGARIREGGGGSH